MNVYEIVTDRIIKELEAGTLPWKKTWSSGFWPRNWASGKQYRGINLFLLPPGEYASFKQITEAKGKVPAGTKGHMVVFFKPVEVDKNDPTKTRGLILRYYTVFEVTQCGLPSKVVKDTDNSPLDAMDDLLGKYLSEGSGPSFCHVDAGRAFYAPSLDVINMPPLASFDSSEDYYSTKAHECIHSTGAKQRLDRFKPDAGQFQFGSESYSKEELVAELGAAMMCAIAGIDTAATVANSAAYIQGWMKEIKEDSRLIVSAASAAQKACDLILGKPAYVKEE